MLNNKLPDRRDIMRKEGCILNTEVSLKAVSVQDKRMLSHTDEPHQEEKKGHDVSQYWKV